MTQTAATASIEGPGKGKAFFDRAKTVAESGNYDYAIDMYIEGLNREPTNIAEHQALRDIALHRKIKGGKAAGGLLGPKSPYKGKTPKEAMLNAEWILAKDPGNIPSMLTMVRNADLAGYRDVVMWVAPILVGANRTNKSPKKDIFLELADIYKKHDEFLKATECVNHALEMSPTDMDLIARIKDLAAQETLRKGKYEGAQSFKDSIKDAAATKDLLQEENIVKSEDYRLKMIEKARSEYEANPKEVQNISKLSAALVAMDDEQYENEAVGVLDKAYKELKVYRFKLAIGDIKMKQMKRNIGILKEALKLDPADKDTERSLVEALKERLAFELEEFKERADHFPTDMAVQYQYGLRLYEAKRFDDAIGIMQLAQNNPRHRVDALHILGRAFLTQGMKPEALETLKKAIDEYDLAETGDQKSKELHYWLARVYEDVGQIQNAINTYSQITQWDFNFRDARQRLAALRAKIEEKK